MNFLLFFYVQYEHHVAGLWWQEEISPIVSHSNDVAPVAFFPYGHGHRHMFNRLVL